MKARGGCPGISTTTENSPDAARDMDRKVPPSSSRSWSSRGSHSALLAGSESSAHSVVPLKASSVPDGYSRASTTMLASVNTSSRLLR